MALDELRALIARHARGDTTAVMEGVLVSRIEEPAPPTTSTTGIALALIAQGAKSLALGDRIYEYRAGQYLVTSVDLPVTGQFTEASRAAPALGFGLTIRPSVVADLVLDPAAGALVPRWHGGGAPPGISVSDAPADLIDAAIRMLRLVERPRDRPILAPMIEREILWILMTGEQGVAVRQLGLSDSSLSRVGEAVRWIRDHYADMIRVDDLADLCRMSASAFHRSFHAVTAMSPIQFQKQIRLQEARIRLATYPGDVAGAAYAVGYESPSQFSREYRRQFGAPPGEDATRLRERARTGNGCAGPGGDGGSPASGNNHDQ